LAADRVIHQFVDDDVADPIALLFVPGVLVVKA